LSRATAPYLRITVGTEDDLRRPIAAAELTAAVAVPTIGIGGSPACDGQILVIDDMLGLFTEFTPKLAKRYRPSVGTTTKSV
jgi:3-methyl-2-oxobutanoate hydroxymethyltransferase